MSSPVSSNTQGRTGADQGVERAPHRRIGSEPAGAVGTAAGGADDEFVHAHRYRGLGSERPSAPATTRARRSCDACRRFLDHQQFRRPPVARTSSSSQPGSYPRSRATPAARRPRWDGSPAAHHALGVGHWDSTLENRSGAPPVAEATSDCARHVVRTLDQIGHHHRLRMPCGRRFAARPAKWASSSPYPPDAAAASAAPDHRRDACRESAGERPSGPGWAAPWRRREMHCEPQQPGGESRKKAHRRLRAVQLEREHRQHRRSDREAQQRAEMRVPKCADPSMTSAASARALAMRTRISEPRIAAGAGVPRVRGIAAAIANPSPSNASAKPPRPRITQPLSTQATPTQDTQASNRQPGQQAQTRQPGIDETVHRDPRCDRHRHPGQFGGRRRRGFQRDEQHDVGAAISGKPLRRPAAVPEATPRLRRQPISIAGAAASFSNSITSRRQLGGDVVTAIVQVDVLAARDGCPWRCR